MAGCSSAPEVPSGSGRTDRARTEAAAEVDRDRGALEVHIATTRPAEVPRAAALRRGRTCAAGSVGPIALHRGSPRDGHDKKVRAANAARLCQERGKLKQELQECRWEGMAAAARLRPRRGVGNAAQLRPAVARRPPVGHCGGLTPGRGHAGLKNGPIGRVCGASRRRASLRSVRLCASRTALQRPLRAGTQRIDRIEVLRAGSRGPRQPEAQ